MDDLEKTMMTTILEANWGLADELAKAKVTFTRSAWRAEDGGTFDTPRIEVSHALGSPPARREQEVSEIYDYYLMVRVYKWSKGTDDTAITTAKDVKWQMMEEVKRIIALYDTGGSKSLPAEWKDLRVMSFRSIDVTELKRPLLGEEFTIRIKFNWMPT